MSRLLNWLRDLFPFGNDGRQTLIYVVFALSGPALTAMTLWIMKKALDRPGPTFNNMAWIVGACLLISVSGLAMFVSLRAVKLGKDGFEAQGGPPPEDESEEGA